MSEKRHQSRLLHIPITEVQMTLDIGSTYVVLLYMNSASSSSVIVDFHLMSIMIICDMRGRARRGGLAGRARPCAALFVVFC